MIRIGSINAQSSCNKNLPLYISNFKKLSLHILLIQDAGKLPHTRDLQINNIDHFYTIDDENKQTGLLILFQLSLKPLITFLTASQYPASQTILIHTTPKISVTNIYIRKANEKNISNLHSYIKSKTAIIAGDFNSYFDKLTDKYTVSSNKSSNQKIGQHLPLKLFDSFRKLNPDVNKYTRWGIYTEQSTHIKQVTASRIDHFLSTKSALKNIQQCQNK